ncbi:hypothetical protein QAD02_008020 [Eretmocerus hayati]|uniref:Uncharacterized protein n=1 Tax=Eretmocerus hayati TaxID=131215 RepID=A0ACC2N5X2_9HYME|nr:hypothetical protein QAD02_008020 [Eretmocerus hayati]
MQLLKRWKDKLEDLNMICTLSRGAVQVPESWEFVKCEVLEYFNLSKVLLKELGTIKKKVKGNESKLQVFQKDVNTIATVTMDQRRLGRNEDILTYNEFKEKYPSMTLLFKTLQDFEQFKTNMTIIDVKDGGKIKKKHLITMVLSHKDVNDACTDVLRDFFKGCVLSQFTASKMSSTDKSKKIFKKTTFFGVFVDAFLHILNTTRKKTPKKGKKKVEEDKEDVGLDEKTLLVYVGITINKSHDWDGGRLLRQSNGAAKKRKITVDDEEDI